MRLLDKMRKLGADALAQAPGVAGRAMAFGTAAASSAADALGDFRELAAARLSSSEIFTEVDVEQAAGAMELLQLGVSNPDGTFRPLSAVERRSMAEVVLAATLKDDEAEK